MAGVSSSYDFIKIFEAILLKLIQRPTAETTQNRDEPERELDLEG